MAEAQELTDAEKHAFAQKRGYPHAVFLWPIIYDRAKAAGYIDMRMYIRQKPMPFMPSTKPRWPCRGDNVDD